ncbi:hypothetical protein [Candidatus Odyssella thessalonicensis]|uniref:hypothetical protein n=1 Tax=Candidatus Odyssella thessalonicensis TaxID=84647 RepID=UPI000225B4FA|nr:hypothetical protein [Candidatus Odyssella thessalonicensis]
MRVRRRCQHQGGKELGSNGTVNICELLINIVMQEQAKGADKLEPKGNVVGSRVEISLFMGIKTTDGKREPNPFNGRINGTR